MLNVDGDGKIHECGAKVNGKLTTNLKNHRKNTTLIFKGTGKKGGEKLRRSSIIFTNPLRLKDNCL